MAFKHTAGDMKARYNKHQSIAASRLGRGGRSNVDAATPGSGHPALPKQTAPGVNRTQTIQKDINKSMGIPKGMMPPGHQSNVKAAMAVMQKSKGVN